MSPPSADRPIAVDWSVAKDHFEKMKRLLPDDVTPKRAPGPVKPLQTSDGEEEEEEETDEEEEEEDGPPIEVTGESPWGTGDCPGTSERGAEGCREINSCCLL